MYPCDRVICCVWLVLRSFTRSCEHVLVRCWPNIGLFFIFSSKYWGSSVCSKVVTESGPDILFTNVHEDLFEQRCARGGTNNVVFNTGTRRTNPLEALSLIQVMKYNHNSTSSSSLVIYLSSIPRDIPVLRSLMLFAARLPLDLIVVCDKTCDETTLLVEMEAAQLKSGGHSTMHF